MRVRAFSVCVCSIIALLLVAGCADVITKQKVGDFGTAFGASSEEQKAIDWFKSTYGDPTANPNDPARFVEPLVTSGISDKNLPVDKVTTFPDSSKSIYFFVIYDNFKKGDPITVSWTYLENGKEVTSVQQQAGGDFGRFIVEFEKPDTGWGKGKQKIMVTGDGATESVDFAIGDALETTPLPYNPEGSTGTGLSRVTTAGPKTSLKQGINDKTGNSKLPQGVSGGITTTATTGVTPAAAAGPDLNTDINNCGRVGNKCQYNPNAETLCVQGQCSVDCFDDYRYCGQLPTGACVPVSGDNDNCGGCFKKCGSGQYCNKFQCEDVGNSQDASKSNTAVGSGSGSGLPPPASGGSSGSGSSTCASGLSLCYGNCVNLQSGLNCGFCGHVCNFPEACMASPDPNSQYRYYCHVPGVPWG